MPANEKKYYKMVGVPAPLLQEFEQAVEAISAEARERGERQVSHNAAFSAFLNAVDLPEAVMAGQALVGGYSGEPKTERGFHVDEATKNRLAAVADEKRVLLGAIGALVLVANGGRIRETIEAGLEGQGTADPGVAAQVVVAVA